MSKEAARVRSLFVNRIPLLSLSFLYSRNEEGCGGILLYESFVVSDSASCHSEIHLILTQFYMGHAVITRLINNYWMRFL